MIVVAGINNPLLALQNNNNTAGAVVVETYKNDLATSTGGDQIASYSAYCNANNNLGVPTKTEMAKINFVAQGVGTNNNDGTIGLACKVNSAMNNFLLCNGGVLPAGEVQVFKPLDMNGNAIRTSSGNLSLDASTSSGTGNITLSAKNPTGEILLVAPNYVNVQGQLKVGASPSYNFVQNDAIDIFDTTTATANTTATLGREGVGFTRLNTLTSLSQSFSFYNDSASGGVIDYQNTIGTNGMILTTNQSIELNTTTLKLANTTTANSTPNHTSALATTSNIGDITTYLKLKLNGNDIWVPYFTQDPTI